MKSWHSLEQSISFLLALSILSLSSPFAGLSDLGIIIVIVLIIFVLLTAEVLYEELDVLLGLIGHKDLLVILLCDKSFKVHICVN
jgi:hypothetical protein